MKRIKRFFALFLMTLLTSSAFAQFSPVDFMRNNPRATFGNPATYTVDNGYFDLGVGNISFSLMNIGLKYDNFFQFDAQGYPVTLDLNKAVAGFRDTNYLNTSFNFDIFNCGRRTKYGYFTYTHRIREVQSFSYTKDLFQLIAEGNASFVGDNPANIDLGFSARLFQEFDLGYQMSLMDKLNVGVRLKFLMGFLDVKTNTFNAKLYTDPDSYALSLQAATNILVSIPYKLAVDNGKIGLADAHFDVVKLFKNYGAGIDLGAEYKINEKFGVGAAINDLGVISWTYYPVNVIGGLQDGGPYYDNGAIVFPGLTSEQITQLMNDSNAVSSLVDSLMGYVNFSIDTTMTKYKTGLNPNMMVRGYYDMTPEHRFSAQFTGYNYGLGMKPALTLAYTGSFKNKYDVVATYTIMPGSYDNFGIGLSANFGGLMMYLASNNVFWFFNPANLTQMNVQMGVSFTSGRTVDRSEMVIIKDKAAEEEALEEEAAEEMAE